MLSIIAINYIKFSLMTWLFRTPVKMYNYCKCEPLYNEGNAIEAKKMEKKLKPLFAH